jgi:signal transduction histidine kinase
MLVISLLVVTNVFSLSLFIALFYIKKTELAPFYRRFKFFTKRSYETESLVKELSENLASVTDRFDALKIVCTTLAQHLEFPHAVIVKQDWQKKEWIAHFLWTLDTHSPDKFLDTWDSTHPIFSHIHENFEPVLLDTPIEKTQFPLKGVLVPIHKNNTLEALLVLAPKLSENGYTRQELDLLSAVATQIGVVLDKIYHRQELQSLNQQLLNLTITLEKRVEEEIDIKKKALHTAQELSHKASLATLSLGIAHEIRNPMTALKGHSGLLRKTLTSRGWQKGVVEASLTDLEFLKAINIIDEEHTLEDGLDLDDPDLELPNSLTHNIYLLNTIKTAWVQKRVLQFCDLIDSLSMRIVKIADTMLKYGIANSSIKPQLFSTIPTLTLTAAEDLWKNMIQHGYLDENGTLLPKFCPEKKGFKLQLDEEFMPFSREVQQILMNTPGAMKQQVDLNKVVADVIELTEGQCKKKRIKLNSHLEKTPMIWGDENRLHQACFNILLNGIQALSSTPPAQRRLDITLNATSTHILLSIQDNGCGIPQEYLDKIQTPFFTTKNPKGGQNVGLGLSILYEVVHFHEGKIDIESEVGVGTCFKISFPV